MKFYARSAMVAMLWSWIGSAGVELLWLPTTMITARLLTPRDFGIFAAASFFLSLSTRMTQFGFNAAILRMKDLDDEHANSVFTMAMGLGVLSWLALTLAAPSIGGFFRSPETAQILPIAALAFLIVPVGTVPNALLARELRYRELTYITWINTLSSSVSTVLLAWLGFGFWSLVYGQLVATVASTLAKILYARWRPRIGFHLRAAREALSFGAAIYVLRLLEYGALNLDSLAVGRTMGMATLGFYDKAFNLVQRVTDRLNQAGPTISFRVFAVIQDEEERFRKGYRKVILSITLIAYPLLAGLAFAASPLFSVLFGRPWLEAALPFQVLCVAGAFKTLNTYAASVVEARGKAWAETWRQGLYAVSIVGGVVALKAWGTVGAAVAVLVATIVMTLLMHSLLRKTTPLTWGDILRPQIPALVCVAGMSVCLAAARHGLRRWDPAPLVELSVLGAVGALFLAGFVWFTPRREVRDLVDDVLEHLLPAARRVLPRAGARP